MEKAAYSAPSPTQEERTYGGLNNTTLRCTTQPGKPVNYLDAL